MNSELVSIARTAPGDCNIYSTGLNMLSVYPYCPIQPGWRDTLFGQIDPKDQSVKVFLVDDSVVIRERMKRMLADVQGVHVIGEAADALAQTTDSILKQKPDVVILDIHLVDGSGIDVLQRLKRAKPAPAVIILTNYPYPQYRQKCLEAGADFFFVKSTEFDRVVPALKQLIQRSHDSTARPPTD